MTSTVQLRMQLVALGCSAVWVTIFASASASASSAPARNCSQLVRGRVLGSKHSFQTVVATSPELCCQMCSATKGCAAFNFEPHQRKGCYLQADAHPCQNRNCSKPAAVSGTVQPGGGGDGGGPVKFAPESCHFVSYA